MSDQGKAVSFTPSQVAAILGISLPTLRRWSKEFAARLSEGARPVRGRHRLYMEADVEVMRQAKELLTLGLTSERVAERLTEEPKGKEELSLSVPEQSAVWPTEFQGLMARVFQTLAERDAELSQALKTIADQREAIAELKEKLEKLERKVEGGERREVEQLKLRLDIMERSHGRSWLARLLGWW